SQRPLDAPPLLEVERLCKHYPVFSKGLLKKQVDTIKACDDISFQVAEGETLGIVGESGSGKTTVGRSILRAVRPTSGHVWYRPSNGEPVDLATLSDAGLKPLRREIQMIFQDPFSSLNPRWTVQQIIAEPLVIHGVAHSQELEDRTIEMMKRVGVRPEYRSRYPHAFSGGQRQ